MSFYNELGNYYEGVFPLNDFKISFIEKNINKNGLTLDIACGIGTDAIALAKLGYKVEGLDLEGIMIKRAKEQAATTLENNTIKFIQSSMLSIESLYGLSSIANILCTGNSLVHLNTIEDINSFIKQAYNLLQDSGVFITQIINFDRVLDQGVTELPTIYNKEKNLTFIRQYEYDKEKHKIKFITKLTADNDYNNVIELLPLRQRELDSILKQNGFKEATYFGSFKGDAYSNDSYATIVVAKK